MEQNNKHEITLGTLYNLNKQAMLKQKPLKEYELKNIKKELAEWFNWQIDCYAMLLCRERYDFTIFHLYETQNKNPPAVAAKELIELLKERGQILSIEKDKTNSYPNGVAWEIWLKINNQCFAYYLFNCDDWTIEC